MNKTAKKLIKIFLKSMAFLAGAFLFILISGFVAVKFNWTKTAGNVDENTGLYNYLADTLNSSFLPSSRDTQDINDDRVYCQLYILSDYADNNAATIFKVYEKNKSYDLVQKMILAIKIRLNDKQALDERLSICDREEKPKIDKLWLATRLQNPTKASVFSWQNEEPWQVIRQAVIKDKDVLNLVGKELNISPRLILSVAIVEQLRLYYTQRELFEQVFKPLKILANANKMAWGVMSIKEAAAIKTEKNLKDKNSAFYLGGPYENVLNFKTNTPDVERYNRLTDSHNHYYSYLYGGLIIKQAATQWQKSGYDIATRPEILATLFNVGLQNSQPKKDPLVGGSTIEINGSQYVFGSLAYEFYYSGDLLADFPYSY